MCIKTSGKIMINSTIATIKKIALTSIFIDKTNKKVIGKFKEEAIFFFIKVSLGCFDDKQYSFTRGQQKFIRLWSLFIQL